MKANNCISADEHRVLFFTILFGFLLRIISFTVAFSNTEPAAGQSFGLYDIFQMTEIMSPLYSFIVFFICIFLVWKVNFISIAFSLILTILLTIFFNWWFIDTQQLIAYAAQVNPDFEFKTYDFILIGGSIYDVLTLFTVNLLCLWQISILYRLSGKTLQNKMTLH